jgi:uncharacterized membrane protein YdbT with pleckstrin-like domain
MVFSWCGLSSLDGKEGQMGYVSANLMKGEVVRHWAKRHWLGTGLGWMAGICFAAAIYGFIAESEAATAVGWFGAGLTPIFAIGALLDHLSCEFALTDRRLFMKTGLLQRKAMEISLSKFESVSIDQGLFGRLLNYGTIYTTGSGGSQQPFPGIAKPVAFKRAIQDALDERQQNAG